MNSNGPKILNKYMLSWLTFLLASITCFSQSNDEPSIKGKLQLDSIWEPVVYLSHIPTFNDMNTMSSRMIIAEAKIDTSGYFSFPTSQLPLEDNLFRIHLSKKGQPATSLIIGGEEENHIFFIANPSSEIHISNADSLGLFGDYDLKGYHPNADLITIDRIIADNETKAASNSLIKREFLENTLNEQLRRVADTSSHPIVSLYALNKSKFESTFLDNQKFYEAYLDKWADDDSSYFRELRNKLPKEEQTSMYWYLIVGIGFFVMGFLINYFFVSKQKKKQNSLLSTLSVQERKIFHLIQSGRSNKEISEEYNIGISTVKSHVSNIYSKLNIKSRKEAMDIK